jgi:hypothetical protein
MSYLAITLLQTERDFYSKISSEDIIQGVWFEVV